MLEEQNRRAALALDTGVRPGPSATPGWFAVLSPRLEEEKKLSCYATLAKRRAAICMASVERIAGSELSLSLQGSAQQSIHFQRLCDHLSAYCVLFGGAAIRYALKCQDLSHNN